MPVTINGTTGIAGPDGSASTPAVQGTDSNTGLFFPAADTVAISTGGTQRITIDSSGNLGLGVTPSAWRSSNPAFQIGQTGSMFAYSSSNIVAFGNNVFIDSAGNEKYITTATAGYYRLNGNSHQWFNAASGTANTTITSLTQAMTLDASGNLLIGNTADPIGGNRVLVQSAATANNNRTFTVYNSAASSTTAFANRIAQLSSLGSGADVTLHFTDQTAYNCYIGMGSGNLYFATNGTTERARITSGGYFKASPAGTYGNSGSFHELRTNASARTVYISNTDATTPLGILVGYTGAAPNGTGSAFLDCEDTAGQRAAIRSNGGLANYQANDVNLSDQRVKKDIAPAPSYWDKIKGIEIVHFKYKDQTHDDNNVGVIAQQVEQVAPEFVDQDGWGETPEDGVPLKSIYTSDMYHAAIKALQEAMTRIETLEAKVAALEGTQP